MKTIYYIKDKRIDKIIYIGQTKDFKNRKAVHFSLTKQPVDLYMYEQGRDNFEVSVLEDFSDDITKEEMQNKEQYYIDLYDTINTGFNKNRSGNISFDIKEYNRVYLKDYHKSEKYKEYIREYNREYYREYRENNKEQWYEYHKSYYQLHKEEIKKKKQEKLNIETL